MASRIIEILPYAAVSLLSFQTGWLCKKWYDIYRKYMEGNTRRWGKYSRSAFGPSLSYRAKHELQSPRQTILERDGSDFIYRDNKIVEGRWVCAYTQKKMRYPSEVEIDHVVSLKYAWERGARRWGYEKRVEFARDPLNLVAVSRSANRSKGDRPSPLVRRHKLVHEKYFK